MNNINRRRAETKMIELVPKILHVLECNCHVINEYEKPDGNPLTDGIRIYLMNMNEEPNITQTHFVTIKSHFPDDKLMNVHIASGDISKVMVPLKEIVNENERTNGSIAGIEINGKMKIHYYRKNNLIYDVEPKDEPNDIYFVDIFLSNVYKNNYIEVLFSTYSTIWSRFNNNDELAKLNAPIIEGLLRSLEKELGYDLIEWGHGDMDENTYGVYKYGFEV